MLLLIAPVAWCLITLVVTASAQSNFVYGSGTTVVSHDIMQVMNTLMSQSKPSTTMAYRAIGTGPGLNEIVNSSTFGLPYPHFAFSGLPVPSANFAQLPSPLLQAPVGVLKVSVWHSIPANTYSGTINLTACLLARIYTMNITTWDHADIAALNPGLNVSRGTHITVIGRTDVSPSCMAFTNYMQTATCGGSPSPWTQPPQRATTTWPAGTVLVTDTDVLIKKLWAADPSYTPYAISFSDYAWGARYNLDYMAGINEVSLLVGSTWANASTSASTTATYPVVNSLLSPSMPAITANWDTNYLQYLTSPGWPITCPILLITKQDVSGFGPATSGLLAALIAYLLSDAGQALLAGNNHVPLSSQVRMSLQSQWSSSLMLGASPTNWTFELAGAALSNGGADYVFSAYRSSYLTEEIGLIDQLLVQVASIQATIANNSLWLANLTYVAQLAAADRAAAADDRARIDGTVQSIAVAEQTAQTANKIAIAGVVLAVILAVAALLVAAVYIVRTKKLDQKYSKYLPLGVKARFDDNPEGI